jgi:hypothetical protein
VGWGVVLAAVFLLPPVWLYTPSIRLLDLALWPLVRAFGKPGAVACIAAGLALATLLAQRQWTDNRRLLAARQRASRLHRAAAGLPPHAPRRRAMQAAAAGVQPRLLAATLVPVAVLLGPLVMVLLWLPARVDPASANPPAGAVAHVVAVVDGDHDGPVRLVTDPELRLNSGTPAQQFVPPIRAVLTQLLARWRQQTEASAETSATTPVELLADLEWFLNGPTPAQELVWTLHTPRQPGRYPITVCTGQTRVTTALVTGDRFPPQPRADLGDGRGPRQVVRVADPRCPVRRVTVQYQFPRTRGDQAFFRPLNRVPRQWLSDDAWRDWDMGWLLTYLAAYLLILLPARRLLRVA